MLLMQDGWRDEKRESVTPFICFIPSNGRLDVYHVTMVDLELSQVLWCAAFRHVSMYGGLHITKRCILCFVLTVQVLDKPAV